MATFLRAVLTEKKGFMWKNLEKKFYNVPFN